MLEDGRRAITEVPFVLLIPGEGEGFLTGKPERVLDLSFQGQVLKSVNKPRLPETRSLQRFHPTRWISAVFRVQARSKQLPNICSSSTTSSTRTSESSHAS